mgnify:CR=1 FL=1
MGHHYRDFMRERKFTMVSGGFDPIHVGHVRMIQSAARQSDGLYVVINSDEWLLEKKGYVFMPWEERAEIIRSIKGITDVLPVDDSDGTVCEVIKRVKPAYFANGGDRTSDNTPEIALCEELGIQMLWNVGGGKVQSSSELVASANNASEDAGPELLEKSAKDIDVFEYDFPNVSDT